MTERIGVVIPVYNGEAFLGQTLASVAAQSLQPDEIVVVDDGSSDGSVAVAEAWASRLPIEVVRQGANRGVCQARRTGIERLSTDLIALLDADDVWLPDHLQALEAAFTDRGGLVTPRALRWVPGAALGHEPLAGRQVPAPEKQIEAMIIMNFVFIGSMFTRADYDDVGGFRDGYDGVEEWDLWLRMLFAGVRIAAPPLPTVLYRIHSDSLSADDRLLPKEILLLENLAGSAPQAFRPAVERSLRHRRARLSLREGYEDARNGRLWPARVHGVRAWPGPRPVRLRGLGLAVAPRWTVQRRDALRRLPQHQVT